MIGAVEGLQRLVAGNARVVGGTPVQRAPTPDQLAHLADAQHPFATILGCSDSRFPPVVFDQGPGDLFRPGQHTGSSSRRYPIGEGGLIVSRTISLTVRFADGEPFKVETEADDSQLRNLAGNIEQAMSASFVGVELEGTLHLFPLHTIRAIEITPAPKAVIKHVVRDVRRVS